MRKLLRSKQAVVVAGGALLAVLGSVAAFLGRWGYVASAGFALMLSVLVLVAHNHKRVADTAVAVRRQRTQLARATETVTSSSPVVTAEQILEAVDRHGVLVQTLLTARVDELERGQREIGHGLLAAAERLERGAGGGPGTSRAELDDLREALDRLDRRTRSDHDAMLQQLDDLRHRPVTELDALHQIHRRFPLEGKLPLLWGAALSPRGLLQILDLALENDCRTVVECGSGTSTLFVAAALRNVDGAKIIALEHDAIYAEVTRSYLRAHGLEQRAEVRLAELTPVEIDGREHRWYDPQALEGLTDVDLLLVDGPPSTVGPEARYPALPLTEPYLADGCIVVLDDVRRRDERRAMKRWREHHRLERRYSMTPDQAVLRWSAPDARPDADEAR